jgi:hypothetical protein
LTYHDNRRYTLQGLKAPNIPAWDERRSAFGAEEKKRSREDEIGKTEEATSSSVKEDGFCFEISPSWKKGIFQ